MVQVSKRQKEINTVSEWRNSAQAEAKEFRLQKLMFETRLVPSMGTMIFQDDVESARPFDLLFNLEDDLFSLLNIVNELQYHEPRWKMDFESSFNINDLLRDRESEFKQEMRTSRVGFTPSWISYPHIQSSSVKQTTLTPQFKNS